MATPRLTIAAVSTLSAHIEGLLGSPSVAPPTTIEEVKTPPRSPAPSAGGARYPPGAPQKPPRNGHKAWVFASAAEQEFAPLNDYRPCRSCSAYFRMSQSADGDHCSADCSQDAPPYSAVPVGMQQMRPATNAEWMAFTEGCCSTFVERLNGTHASASPISLLTAAAAAPGPASPAPTMSICQHWWPLNAPQRCSDC